MKRVAYLRSCCVDQRLAQAAAEIETVAPGQNPVRRCVHGYRSLLQRKLRIPGDRTGVEVICHQSPCVVREREPLIAYNGQGRIGVLDNAGPGIRHGLRCDQRECARYLEITCADFNQGVIKRAEVEHSA